MAADALADLQQELGTTPPPGVAALAPEHLDDLAGAIRAARHRQAAELAAAGDQALKLVPRVLRGPIRRLAR